MFEKGDRVNTPMGTGKVLYKRMKGPEYSEVSAYCVLLDKEVDKMMMPPFPSYSGTIFAADKVEKE